MRDSLYHQKLGRRVRRIVEFLPGLGWAASPEGHIVYVSESLKEYLGNSNVISPPEDPGEFSWQGRLLQEDYGRIAERWRSSISTGALYDVTHQCLCADGSFRWLRTAGKPVRDRAGHILYWLGMVVDIDEAMREAERAQSAEAGYQALLDTIPVPIWSADAVGTPLYSNKAHTAQTGQSIEKIHDSQTNHVTDKLSLVHPDDRPLIRDDVARSFATGEPINVKYRKRLGDGSYRWVNNKAEALRDETGGIKAWFGVSLDIDEEIRHQTDLAEREAKLRSVVDTLPALIWIADRHGEPHYFNRRFGEWTGLFAGDFFEPASEAYGGSWSSLVHPDDLSSTMQAMLTSLQSGAPWTHRLRLKRADGSFGWAEVRMAPLRNGQGEIVEWYGLSLDIDREVQAREALEAAQAKLSRATQLASMAEMSASIAHEIAQPLATVAASSEACRRWLDADPPNIARAKLSSERALLNAVAASDVISRIRGLFRRSAPQRSSHSIDSIILTAIELASDQLAASGTKIVTDFTAELPPVQVDPVEIQQVVFNLVKNAVEAMSKCAATDRFIFIDARTIAHQLVVTVEDNGPGLADSEGIFEPFVTSKENGMGIGLAVCRSILSNYDGHLWAENTERGAKFSLSFRLAPSDS